MRKVIIKLLRVFRESDHRTVGVGSYSPLCLECFKKSDVLLVYTRCESESRVGLESCGRADRPYFHVVKRRYLIDLTAHRGYRGRIFSAVVKQNGILVIRGIIKCIDRLSRRYSV